MKFLSKFLKRDQPEIPDSAQSSPKKSNRNGQQSSSDEDSDHTSSEQNEEERLKKIKTINDILVNKAKSRMFHNEEEK